MTIAQALKSGLDLTHRNLRLLLLQIVLNAVTLGLFYFFLRTPETSVPELIASLVLALAVLFLFVLTQGGTFGTVAQAGGFFRQGIRNSWRFILILVPIAGLGYLAFLGHGYLLRKAAPVAKPATIAFYIVCGVILPSMLITLWISVARNGLAYSLKNGLRILFGRALRGRPLLIYSLSFILFALLPYFLLAIKTPSQQPWLEFSILTLRLSFAYLLVIYGWTIMAGAMAALLNDER